MTHCGACLGWTQMHSVDHRRLGACEAAPEGSSTGLAQEASTPQAGLAVCGVDGLRELRHAPHSAGCHAVASSMRRAWWTSWQQRNRRIGACLRHGPLDAPLLLLLLLLLLLHAGTTDRAKRARTTRRAPWRSRIRTHDEAWPQAAACVGSRPRSPLTRRHPS